MTECQCTSTTSLHQTEGKSAVRRLEPPSNPLLGVADLPALIDSAHHQTGALVVVDSTFTTPILQRPLEMGADFVMHSVTKYIGGHSDLLMGALVARAPAHAEVLCCCCFKLACLDAPSASGAPDPQQQGAEELQ